MDLMIGPNTVAYENRDTAPATGTPGWATGGNPAAGIPASGDQAYEYNAIIEELINVIQAGGLTLDRNNNAQLLAAIRSVATGRLLGSISFPASGSYAPSSAAVKQIKVWCTGAGGGGSECKSNNQTAGSTSGGGGGAGGTAVGLFQLSALVLPVPITVGAGGTSQLSGGTSTFGDYLTANGGTGSNFNQSTSSAGGLGGTASGGIYNLTGGDGGDGQAGGFIFAGNGGGSYWGGGGRAGNQGGFGGRAYGAAGGGAYDASLTGNAFSGGTGQAGFVIVEEYT